MDLESLVNVKPLNLLGEGERGSTYEYSVRENGDYVLLFRKAGSLSGNTYHKGLSSATAPKTFVLISGEIKFNYRHISQKEHQTIKLNSACIIEVQPLVTHSVEAVTDIIMLECNSIADIELDRHKEDVLLKDLV